MYGRGNEEEQERGEARIIPRLLVWIGGSAVDQ